jgi:hypothetical protein
MAVSGNTTIERDGSTTSKDQEAKENWVCAVLGVEPGRSRSGAITMGGQRKPPPQPQWVGAKPTPGETLRHAHK